MSNTRKARPRREPDVSARIAQVTGEGAADVKAAIAALVADGIPFDEVWETHLRAALEGFEADGTGVVDYCARILAEREKDAKPFDSMVAAEAFVTAIEKALKDDPGRN